MSNSEEFLIDTDIIIEHLVDESAAAVSDLEIALSKGICFTTVLNASELYLEVNDIEKKFIDDVLNSLKVLGIHSRYALSVSELSNNTASIRDALFCVVAIINKLPVLTYDTEKYKECGVKIIHPEELRK